MPIAAAGFAGAGLFSSIGSAYAQQAQGYLQQAGYAAQAKANLELSGLRADKEIEYAEISFARRKFQTQIEQLNYKAQANSLLDNLRRANASARARAAAAGLDPGGGGALAIQEQNVRETYRDVGMVDLSALVSRVFGMEDATNILRAGYDNAFYTRQAALQSASQMATAGQYATQTGGLLATATLTSGLTQFAMNVPTQGFFSGSAGGLSGQVASGADPLSVNNGMGYSID
jgi:hypothetical protein